MMLLNPVDEIKKRLDIVTVIEEYLSLEKSSDRYVGYCPFHSNTNTPAFTVYPNDQRFWCFGCNKGGDVITFLMEMEKKTFPAVIEEYAEKFGIEIRELSPTEKAIQEQANRLYEILEAATQIFHDCLMWGPEASGARVYLQHRGIDAETLANFRIGYAPDSWDWLSTQLLSRGFTLKDILTTGLGKMRRDGKGCYDFFRNRIIFPIQTNGKVMGFGGRIVSPSTTLTKYINTPNTPVFSKRNALYGLVQARRAIHERGSVTLVEGYMDMLALYQAGYKNTVSIMGISLTQEQAELLGHHAKRAILAFDPDEAAELAVERLKIEKFTGLDLYIASLPGNKDPDELVKEDSDLWDSVIESAKPIPIYMTDYLINKHRPTDPKQRRDVANMVIPLIDSVVDPFEQVGYQQYLAEALGYKNFQLNPICPHCGKKYRKR